MPTKRRRRTRSFSTLTLRSLAPIEFLCLTAAFLPGTVKRWPTWEAYLSDYETMREDLLERQRLRFGDDTPPPFAERLRTYVGLHGMEHGIDKFLDEESTR